MRESLTFKASIAFLILTRGELSDMSFPLSSIVCCRRERPLVNLFAELISYKNLTSNLAPSLLLTSCIKHAIKLN
jgi:hypothetical protein